jgi:hypothetical protein
VDLQGVEHLQQIAGHVVGRVAGRRHVAVPVAPQVVGQDLEAVHQHRCDLQVPDREVAGQPVDHHQVRALADALVMQAVATAQLDLWHLDPITRCNPAPAGG